MVADTDVFIDYLAGEGVHARVADLLREARLGTTAVTAFEIWRGLRSDAAREAARRALRGVRVYALTDAAARRAADIHQQLETNPIGERDTLIAGICVAIRRPLLTRNVRHFRRVRGLDVVPAR